MQWLCSTGSDGFVHNKDTFLIFFYFTADLTDYSTEMTGSKGLSTKDNMLDLFEILRGHYSPADYNSEVKLVNQAVMS